VIEKLLANHRVRRFAPPLAGVIFASLFIALGFWQLDRAAQKKALLAHFASDAPYTELHGQLPKDPFQPIETRGRYVNDRQVLIENIVRDGRLGYFVITPFEESAGSALLLVNRGWLPVPREREAEIDIDVGDAVRRIRGRAGHLPGVSVRPGDSFAGAADWPKKATYPTLEEVARELQDDLLPYVLLLAADQADGYRREWQPQQSGPMTNYSYAFQWFAMAAAVLVILAWHFRKGVSRRASVQ
jgi:surfeit locus 1 family protein